MNKIFLLITAVVFAANGALAGNITIGEKLPSVTITDKGEMVFEYEVVDNVMKFKEGGDITYKPFNSDDLTGRIRTVYHMAARTGIEPMNQPYIDALIAAQLPERMPEGAFKTTTILNTDDAMWGTSGVAGGRLEDSQQATAYAYFVTDAEGLAQQAWGLDKKSSAIIVLDRDGKVLFFKDGKLSDDEIATAVKIIQDQLAQ